MHFEAGVYVYIGSAMRGFRARLSRYLRPIARPHWHIDRLLPRADFRCAVLGETREESECLLAAALGRNLRLIPRFGSSDCRCRGHLFLAAGEEVAYNAVSDALQSLKLRPFTMGRGALMRFLGL